MTLSFSTQRPRLLTFYIVKEILPICLLTFAILTVLVFGQQLSRNNEVFFSPLINWGILFQVLASLLPPIFTFTLPVAIVLGEILALSRLATDHEWVALEAGGLSKLTRFGPFLSIGAFGFALVLLLNWNIAPQSLTKLKEARNLLLIANAESLIRPESFVKELPEMLLRVNAIDRVTKKWEGVLLLRKDEASSKFSLLAARSGKLAPLDDQLNAFEIKLSDGVFIQNLLSTNDHVTSAFKENTIKVNPTKPSTGPLLAELSTAVQLSSMNDLLSRAQSGQGSDEVILEIYKRFTNALGCFFASLCALSVASLFHGRAVKRSLLLFTGFLALVIYYVSVTFGQNLILKGNLSTSQGLLLGITIPAMTLVLFQLASSNRFSVIRTDLSKGSSLRVKVDKKYDRDKESSVDSQVPPFNLGNYLVLSEFVKLLAITLMILMATILLFTLLDIAPSITRNNIKIGFAIGYLLRLSPQILYYVTPFGILVAVVATATSLAKTGQLTLLLYYSSSPFRLILPIIIGVFLIFLSILLLSDTILPISNREQDNRYRKIKGKKSEDITFAFDRQWISDESSSTIYGTQVLNEGDGQKTSTIILKLTDPVYFLHEALYVYSDNNISGNLGVSPSFRYKIEENGLAKFSYLQQAEIPAELRNRESLSEITYHEASKMTYQQLKTYILQVEKTGLPTLGLRMEKTQKLAFPFACITLLFLSFPVCLLQIQRQYQSRFSSVAISVALALLFWAVLSIFETAGKRGTLPILIAAWSPHALFLALASTIQMKLHHP